MNIKTVTTTTGMNTVVFGNSANVYYWVKNIGSNDITVGATNNAENHAIVKPDNGIRVDTFTNTVYINGAGTVEIYECDTPVCPFKSAQRGGDITATGNPVQLDGLQGGVPFSEMVVSGKNLIPYPYYDGDSKTHNGITFTVNADGTITANGTATASAIFYISTNYTIKKGIYTLSGCPKSESNTNYILQFATSDWSFKVSDFGNGVTTQIDNDINLKIFRIAISSGVVCDNLVFHPQLELGSAATEYEPPITGRELTVNVNGTDYTITPDSNPYIVPNDIRQQDGLNTITVSEGEISVVGVRKNAAIKRIWDEIDEIKTAIIVSNGESE